MAIKTERDGRPARFVVDVHQHWLPLEALKQTGQLHEVNADTYRMDTSGVSSVVYRDSYDIGLADEVNAKAGVDARLLLPSMEVTALEGAGMNTIEASKHVHDATAGLISDHAPGLFSLACVSPFEPGALREAERAIEELDFKGLCLESSWLGRFYDSNAVYPYFEFAQAHGCPIFMHPPQLPYGYEIMNIWRLEETVGRPADTAMSVARMIFSGLLDRYPEIQIVLAHIGGDVIPVLGRLDFAHRLGYEGLPAGQEGRNKLPPSEYMRRNFAVDTMGFNRPTVGAAIEVFGSDRMMFGSDYGPVPISPAEHIEIINELDLTQEQRENIFWRNANRTFQLSLDAALTVE